jgi:hypothetical protein
MYGEVDFVILAPQYGVFALEVKGGRVARADGVWKFTDRYGVVNTKPRGPFEQAREGMFSIREAVARRFGRDHKLAHILFGWGVMFPDIEFDVDGVEECQWQVFDSRDKDNSAAYIRRLAANTRRQWIDTYGAFSRDKLPDKHDIKELLGFLRGDFDKTVSLSSSIQQVEAELVSLTAEQTRCLDQLEDNPRCLIEGGAGTGKTLIAVEAATKAAADGEKTAFFCYNKLLAAWLKARFERLDPSLRPAYIGGFHDFMFQIAARAGVSLPGAPQGDSFWRVDLPLAALEAVEILEMNAEEVKFDRIVIDEAQDLLNEDYLEVFDSVLKRGVERGRWFIFGDFSQQAIFSGVDGAAMKDMLDARTAFTRFRLKTNCRNTKPIADEITRITGFDRDMLYIKTDGPPVSFFLWKNHDDEKEQIEALIERLRKEKVPDSRITILAPYRRARSVVDKLSVPVEPFSPNPSGITFSTIQGFKGLENSCVILADIYSYGEDELLYVALSRARSALFVFENRSAREERQNKARSASLESD